MGKRANLAQLCQLFFVLGYICMVTILSFFVLSFLLGMTPLFEATSSSLITPLPVELCVVVYELFVLCSMSNAIVRAFTTGGFIFLSIVFGHGNIRFRFLQSNVEYGNAC